MTLVSIIAVTLANNVIQAKSFIRISDKIIVNKAAKTLIAPHAMDYQWFHNENPTGDSNREIKIEQAGTYTVKMTDENGEIQSRSIRVALDRNGEPIVIYTIGDSTVQDYTDYYYPQTGWGQVLQYFFDEENVEIINEAVGGTSAKSFYNSFWESIRSELKPGNFVFIQFGINDANSDTARYTIPGTTFKEYLTKFVTETQAAGAFPVIVATVHRNAWNADGTAYAAYHDYPIASRELAGELGVPLIDLDSIEGELMESLGEDYVTYYWYMNLDSGEYPSSSAYSGGRSDNVHFQEMGALEMARLVAEEIKSLSDDANVSTLIPYLKELHEITVSPNLEEYAGLITRAASYPEGANITLKVKPETGCNFIKWSSETADSISDEAIIQFEMGTGDTSYTAHFYYPPRIEIINPTDGDEIELGVDIELSVYARDVSETNPQMVIYDGTVRIATINYAPYSITFSNFETGEHTLVAKAYNIYEELMESSSVTITVDDGYPKITLDEPNGDVFYELDDTLFFSATAYDSNGTLANVSFYVNDESIAVLTEGPYTFEMENPGIGIYTIYASATDNDGNVTETDALTAEIGPMTTFQESADGYCGITNDAGTIDTDHEDYTGDGFINVTNEAGTTINWTVNFVDTGNYKIVFRYSATTVRPGDVTINGEYVGTVQFPATESWDVWDFSSVNYSVTETGDKPLSIKATGSSGLPNIDYMKIISLTSTTKAEASAECLDQPDEPQQSVYQIEATYNFAIYPVPAQDYIFVKSFDNSSISNIAIYRYDGALVKTINEQGSIVEISCNDMKNGIYIMQLTIGEEIYKSKFNIIR